jgi:hypothetical protein
MKQKIDYKISAEITNDLPDIQIVISYVDDFTDDTYIIQSDANEKTDSKNIPFVISKNNQTIGKLDMTERDTTGFFETMFADINDADFREQFFSNIFKPLSVDISKFIKRYENLVIDNELTVEGEVKRMRSLSGIL